MSNTPEMKDDPLYRLLRRGKVKEFNQEKAAGVVPDLADCDFRGINLTGLDAAGLDFGHCYFRQADLRGIDFREANLDGASIHSAKISGAYFPTELSAEEIMLSLQHGTRMRYRR